MGGNLETRADKSMKSFRTMYYFIAIRVRAPRVSMRRKSAICSGVFGTAFSEGLVP